MILSFDFRNRRIVYGKVNGKVILVSGPMFHTSPGSAQFAPLRVHYTLGRLAQVHEKLHGPTKAQKCAKKSPGWVFMNFIYEWDNWIEKKKVLILQNFLIYYLKLVLISVHKYERKLV